MREYSSFWCLLILLLKYIVPPTIGKTCLPSYHRFIANEDTYRIFNRRDFTSKPGISSGNFLPMILDKNNRLIIGAKDYIFYLDATTLKEVRAYDWKSDADKMALCQSTYANATLSKDCANYIHFLAIYKDKLFMCGTNSLSPKYKLVDLENLKTIKEKADSEVCSYRQSLAMVGDITKYGELISGSYKDFYAKYPVISATFIIDNPRKKEKTIKTTENNVYMKGPQFVSSVSVEESVYIFFMEKAIENKDVDTATVVRLCKTDNGGSRLISENMWTTFRKSRLVCKVTENGEVFHFQNLVDVVYDKSKDVFYASYTMFKHRNMHSAVCTFSRQDVVNTFSGKFLETKDSNIQSVDNGNFLDGCKVNPADLNKKFPGGKKFEDQNLLGKQPTNYLNTVALQKAKWYVLMEKKVHNRPDVFEFMQSSVSFTRLALDPVGVKSLSVVLNIGTKSGSILMVYKKGKNSKPCIIEEVSTNIGRVQRLLLNEDKRILYASSDTNVINLSIDDCHIHDGKEPCIEARNPRCGWSLSKKRCISTWNVSDASDIVQHLNSCATRLDFFGSWSEWSPCEYSLKKYCWCRHRSCDSCDASLCKNGVFNEVKGCSVNNITNLTKWEKEGSIDGGWSKWRQWSNCSTIISTSKCGNNTRSRSKTCTFPTPANGGRYCFGDSFQCQSCPHKPVVINAIWGGWSNWGECTKASDGYVWNRSRNCSTPDVCSGPATKQVPCVPQGIKWGPWTNCTCAQRVRHRYPELINGCDNCTQLHYPHYQVCIPPPHCFTTTISTEKRTTIKKVTEPYKTTQLSSSSTSKPTKTDSSSTAATEPSMKTSNSIPTRSRTYGTPHRVPTITEMVSLPIMKGCPPSDLKFTLNELIIIITVIIVVCFVLFGLIIYLLIKRKHISNTHLNGRANSNGDRTPLKNVSIT